MKKIEEGMLLYHGSYCEIRRIQLSECIAGKDFGKGFYLTSSFDQAQSFVKLSVRRNRGIGRIPKNTKYGFVNIYEVTGRQNFKTYYFDTANIEWLHFVSGNRDASLFPEIIERLKTKNVIGGKIANDRTAATLQAYIDGINGEPGEKTVDKNTIEALLPNRLADQYCFRDEKAIAGLKFIKSERVMIDG